MNRIDWADLLRAGLFGLRLTPDQFWRLTPAELRMMLGQGAGQAPMTRSGLETLMAAWPDGPREQSKGESDG